MPKLRLPAVLMRFLLAGGANTLITYAVYLGALWFLEWRYTYSYTLAYALGLVLAYVLNRHFVFKSHRGWWSVLLLPVIYVAQYVLGLFIVWLWVSQLGGWPELAPLAAIAGSLPVTFLLSKWLFANNEAPSK